MTYTVESSHAEWCGAFDRMNCGGNYRYTRLFVRLIRGIHPTDEDAEVSNMPVH